MTRLESFEGNWEEVKAVIAAGAQLRRIHAYGYWTPDVERYTLPSTLQCLSLKTEYLPELVGFIGSATCNLKVFSIGVYPGVLMRLNWATAMNDIMKLDRRLHLEYLSVTYLRVASDVVDTCQTILTNAVPHAPLIQVGNQTIERYLKRTRDDGKDGRDRYVQLSSADGQDLRDYHQRERWLK